MLVLLDPNDSRAVRNKDAILMFYDLLINSKKSMEVGARCLGPVYIQHNPLLENDLGASRFFEKVTSEHAGARVVVHKIVAIGDYVWAHVNFLNVTTDDPNDTGIAGVDIFCSWSALRKTRYPGSLLTSPRPTQTACSKVLGAAKTALTDNGGSL
jgi:predicted SnoaL-like aldol condensation-catalyzing enzyme